MGIEQAKIKIVPGARIQIPENVLRIIMGMNRKQRRAFFKKNKDIFNSWKELRFEQLLKREFIERV